MAKLVILGAGESGRGAAVLAKHKGYDVFVSDASPIPQQSKSLFDDLEIPYEENKHDEGEILNADMVVKSPGIPEDVPVMQWIRKANIPVKSEIEFAFGYCSAKIIGITGSNGKTTTTMLIYHLLKKAGLNVGIAGNIGKSFAQQVAEKTHDYYVLEISSFQLDDIQLFSPEIAIITNITPDHLDRYKNDFSRYVSAKLAITENQSTHQFLLFNARPCFDQCHTAKLNRRTANSFWV